MNEKDIIMNYLMDPKNWGNIRVISYPTPVFNFIVNTMEMVAVSPEKRFFKIGNNWYEIVLKN